MGEVTDSTTRVVSPALVGRTAELDRVATAVAAPPALVVVDGEAGIGKTRLVTELRGRPELADRRLLVGRCHHIRESFPLGPMIEALRELGPALSELRLSPVAGALRPLLPELADWLPSATTPLDDRGAERHRVFRALVAVLDELGPAVLVLEDLHWADDQTADWLTYLLSDLPDRLAVVLTYRGDEVDPRVRSLPARMPASTTRRDITLRPLDVSETGALAAAIVGAERVSEEFAAHLRERTSGLPFAIEELLALLRTRGTLVRRDGGWARRTLDALDVPTGIRDPVRERVSRLSTTARPVVEAAAVLQIPTGPEPLLATADATAAALDEALESGLLAETKPGLVVGFRHLLAAQAVYDDISGPRRRRLHGRAADTLAAVAPVPLGQVAHHLRHAGRLAEWVDAAEQAAAQALDLGHDAEAFRLLEDVLRQAPLDPERRGRLAVRLGQAAIETLRARDVVTLLADVLDEELPGPVRGELHFQVGMLLHDIGDDPLRVRELLVGAIADLAERPDLRAWAMVVLGIPTAEQVRIEEHRAWLGRALDTVPEIDDPDFEVFLLGKVAMVLVPFGDPRWRELAEGIRQRTSGAAGRRREINAYLSVGTEACYAGHHDTAGDLLRIALAGAVAGENRRLALSIRSAQTLLDFARGSWEGLDDDVTVLIDELAQHPRARIDAEIVAGCLALVRGDIDDAQRRLPTVVDRCLSLGAFDVLPVAMGAQIRLELARGDDPMPTVRRLIESIEAKGFWATDARAVPAVAEALLTTGRGVEAEAFVERCRRELSDLDAPLAPASIGHARGFLRRAAGQDRTAARHFLDAARDYHRLPSPWEAAAATEQAAVSLLTLDDHAAATKALQSALSTYRDLDAARDASRAAKLARDHGLSVPARHRGGRRGFGNRLSPREREVAELAAAGRTNKEIAAELFLSANTVARHVSAAMRKLGVRSRTGLAHQLPADES